MSDKAPNINIKPENLVFIPHSLPQMVAGEYELSTEIKGIKDKNDNVVSGLDESRQSFYIDAPRFFLNLSSIYSVYPPQDHYGHLESTLPHILFNRRTLPWERTIDGELAKDQTAPTPWMALILLTETEIKQNPATPLKPKNCTYKDLIQAEADFIKPDIQLNPWEKEDKNCQVIDIPYPLFKRIAPTLDDLPFLSHVKKVEIDKNKEAADVDDDGYFSALIGNRLPSQNTEHPDKDLRHTSFLVSLEGHQQTLNRDNIYSADKKVRLIVLHSWNFIQAKGKNFRELCQDLSVRQFKYDYNGKGGINEDLKKALDFGYVPLPHQLRKGSDTYSWYRGPFSPDFVPSDPRTRTFRSPDKALRFDQKSGMMDTSYAAAWQLGRLLALKDQSFSDALFTWKNKYSQLENSTNSLNDWKALMPDVSNEEWQKLLPDQGNGEPKAPYTMEDLVQNVLEEKYEPRQHDQQGTAPSQPAAKKLNPARPPIPPIAKDWMARLFLLYGVPFQYLVPHEKMLQEESLVNFHLDYGWLECLLDGALSIARTSDSETLMNEVMDGEAMPDDVQALRTKMAADIPKTEKGGAKIELSDDLSGFMSGFLLRSKLISGWKGVKVFAKGITDREEDGYNALIPLRLERIQDDVLLCLFERKVRQIILIQPPESLHFGLEEENENFAKKLRFWKGDQVGVIDDNKKVEVPFHEKNYKVVNIKALAEEIKSEGGQDEVGSAQFAFHMVESPILYTLDINF